MIALDVDGARVPICGTVIALDTERPASVLLCAEQPPCREHPDPRPAPVWPPARLLSAPTDPTEDPSA